jgi:hypothetical protein
VFFSLSLSRCSKKKCREKNPPKQASTLTTRESVHTLPFGRLQKSKPVVSPPKAAVIVLTWVRDCQHTNPKANSPVFQVLLHIYTSIWFNATKISLY